MEYLPAPASKASQVQVSWQLIQLLIINSLAIVFTLGTVLTLVVMGLGGMFARTTGILSFTPIFLYAGGLLWCAVLLVPSTFLAVTRMIGKSGVSLLKMSEKGEMIFLLLGGLVLLPVALVLGEVVSRNQQISWFFLPPLHIFAASIPVSWLLLIGLRKLNAGSQLRKWAVFGSGLVYAPNLILIVEIFIMAVGFIGLAFMFSSNPVWLDEVLSLGQRLRYSAGNPEILSRILEPILVNPLVIFGIFTFVAVMVPLVEETLKPIGMWVLAGKKLTPAQGLALGFLSGGGYALFENLFLAATDAGWGVTVIARAGTTGIHILTGGLTGWGLAYAWSKGNYIKLAINYGLAVILHGLWNGLVILYIGLSLISDKVNLPFSLQTMQNGVMLVLVLLASLTFVVIIGLNKRMQKQEIKEEQIVIESQEEVQPEIAL